MPRIERVGQTVISCKDVSGVLLSDQLKSQPWPKRWEIRLHLAMCRHCSSFARQLRKLSAAARAARFGLQSDSDFEKRLLEKLKKSQ